jgi:hypothetical protein
MENRTAVNGILILVRTLKERKKKELETQTSVVIKEEEEAIKELENQGDLKKDVPVGGEEFENEEPRQGE